MFAARVFSWLMFLALAGGAIVLPFAGGAIAFAQAQAAADELDPTAAAVELARVEVERARARNFDVITPRHFDKAVKHLADAESAFEKGDAHKAADQVDACLTEVQVCRDLFKQAQVIFKQTLLARFSALVADAPRHDIDVWRQAEDEFKKAGRKLGDGNEDAARKGGERAVELYRDCELTAIRAGVMGRAQEVRAAAVAQKADKHAAITLSRGDGFYREAESVLEADRYRQGDAVRLAEAAIAEYDHAASISETIQEAVGRDPAHAYEQIINKYETQLSRVAAEIGFRPSYAAGVEPVADDMVIALQEARVLYTDLLLAQEDHYARELQKVRAANAELEPLEFVRTRLSAIQQIFPEDQAEVSLNRGDLVIRLHGMSFATGSAAIVADHVPLLRKLEVVVSEFRNFDMTIEGHTDSQGNDAINAALSQRRAEAVRDFLTESLALAPDAVDAIGFGEARPITSNDTAEGRAANRRIDCVIDLRSGGEVAGN